MPVNVEGEDCDRLLDENLDDLLDDGEPYYQNYSICKERFQI